MAYQGRLQQRSGTLELMGEDANGRNFNLSDVSQAALLFVPRETLPYLKGNQKLWVRVKNPEATADERSSLRNASKGGMLAALLVGPIMDSLNASLLPGEFRISVVDTYADAQMKIKGLGLDCRYVHDSLAGRERRRPLCECCVPGTDRSGEQAAVDVQDFARHAQHLAVLVHGAPARLDAARGCRQIGKPLLLQRFGEQALGQQTRV
jgi:hypothetical protein